MSCHRTAVKKAKKTSLWWFDRNSEFVIEKISLCEIFKLLASYK